MALYVTILNDKEQRSIVLIFDKIFDAMLESLRMNRSLVSFSKLLFVNFKDFKRNKL